MIGGIFTNVASNPYIYDNTNSAIGTSSSLSIPADSSESFSVSEEKALKRSGQVECETCSSRKYQDGSDEMVSFKSASHISPEASASRVRAHEQEHVANAYSSASNKNNGKVINASVSLKTSICPECGRSYVAGGTTNTTIKYSEDNPYGQKQKSFDQANGLIGSNIDYSL